MTTPEVTALRGLHAMRDGVVGRLGDDDLPFGLGGDTPTVGQLLAALADLEESYARSLRDRVQQWPDLAPVTAAGSVAALRERFAALDRDLEAALDDARRTDEAITRPAGEVRTPEQQLEIYSQAVLIVLGKAVVYLQALSRSLPPSVAHYIG